MKVSLNWLKKYTLIHLDVDELVARIGTQLGAVEEVTDLRGHFEGIVVVQITEAKPHLDADKLNVYQATTGREHVQVVSGDRTLNVGDKVAWLPPGTIVPSTIASGAPVIMEARELRGEMSNGMFGSGKELGINDDHEGVLKLDADAPVSKPLAEVYELDDVIIDIENKMFTHRPDCFGLLGVAREVAGIQQLPFTSPDWYLLEAGKLLKATAEPLPLHITNDIPSLCPYYQAAVMSDIKVGPSPVWLRSYLKRIGIRPIGNVVDVTNYLMYLTGQPLHAFDYDKVAALDGHKHAAIVVRTPQKGETLKLLDGRMIEPHEGAILICSRHKPIALGGIMGGAETEVDAGTANIIIESANFNMYAVRRTSMEHGIFTDAVTRFSKGQSIAQCGVVLAEAVGLMGRHASGQLASELAVAAPERPEPVAISPHFINERLGGSLPPTHIERLLKNVEFKVDFEGGHMRMTPGFWRTDIEIPEDVVEEVGRLQGYGELPHSLPLRTTEAVDMPSIETLKTTVRNLLAEAGNNELQTYSFVSAKLLEKTGQDTKPAYRLRNAISPELQYIRTSLLPSLLDKVHANHKAGFGQFGIFEIGKSHNKYELGDDDLPRERLGLSYIFSAEPKTATQWSGAPFYQAKRMLEYLFGKLHLPMALVPLGEAKPEAWWLQNLTELFESKRSAVILFGDMPLGIIGEFAAHVRRNFKLPDFIAGLELDLGAMNGLSPAPAYQPLLRFPATEQDICFRIAADVSYAGLASLISAQFAADERLRVTVRPLDIFQRPRETAHKQITYRITLQHHDRTLTTDEANAMMTKLAGAAKAEFSAERV
jgi:phenylalanyl-tRNA synthetase beta chain